LRKPVQPVDPKPASPKLASFPQIPAPDADSSQPPLGEPPFSGEPAELTPGPDGSYAEKPLSNVENEIR
jgi:hypothetical protein